jgi:hypothetical protein
MKGRQTKVLDITILKGSKLNTQNSKIEIAQSVRTLVALIEIEIGLNFKRLNTISQDLGEEVAFLPF